MYVDPMGDSFTIAIFILTTIVAIAVVSLVTFCVIATSPANYELGDNVSISTAASPDPTNIKVAIPGYGLGITLEQPGITCDLYGCQNSYQTSVAAGPYGYNSTTYEDGSTSTSLSFLFFYVSLENSEFSNVSAWGAGLSFSAATQFGQGGGGSVALNYDFLGILTDSVKGFLEDNKYGK